MLYGVPDLYGRCKAGPIDTHTSRCSLSNFHSAPPPPCLFPLRRICSTRNITFRIFSVQEASRMQDERTRYFVIHIRPSTRISFLIFSIIVSGIAPLPCTFFLIRARWRFLHFSLFSLLTGFGIYLTRVIKNTCYLTGKESLDLSIHSEVLYCRVSLQIEIIGGMARSIAYLC